MTDLLCAVCFSGHFHDAVDLVFERGACRVDFELLGDITEIELIAKGRRLRVRRFLRQEYGGRRWRKLKGVARVRLEDGRILDAEVHWYEAHGIGRKDFKIARLFAETE